MNMPLLEMVNRMLAGEPVAKAMGEEDPDAIQPGAEDDRASEASPDQASIDAARQEAQAGQQGAAAAGGQPDGEGGPGAQEVAAAAAAPKGEGGEDEAGEGDDAPEVSKAELLESMRFLANAHGLTNEEVVKAFSGTEGDPTTGRAPVGHGVEMLERIVSGVNSQGKVLEAIAASIIELTKHHVKLGGEVSKALDGVDAVKAETTQLAETVAALPKTAPAAAAKGVTEIAKAEGGGAPLSAKDLFQVALSGNLTPSEVAAANRRINYDLKQS